MSSKRFIDGRKHTYPIMHGMESSSDGSIPVKARKKLIEPILRRTPRTPDEIEISNDSTRLLSASEKFIKSSLHVKDPFIQRKNDLAKIGELEVSTRLFPNILEVGSFSSENIFKDIDDPLPSKAEVIENNLQILKQEVYDNLKNRVEFT